MNIEPSSVVTVLPSVPMVSVWVVPDEVVVFELPLDPELFGDVEVELPLVVLL